MKSERKISMNGKIIVIEGLDGCGKSTQVDLLKSHFSDCSFLSFPDYASHCGAVVTEYLSGGIPEDDPERSAYSASTFYAMDRYVSFRKHWKDLHASGTNIISARYTTSNAIYQMTKLPRSMWKPYCTWLYDFEYEKLGIPRPDAVIFLDVPVEISQKLLSARYGGNEEKKDIHEANPDYLRHCRDAALYAAELDSGNPWKILNCCKGDTLRPIAEIQNELIAIIHKIFTETF